VWDPRQARAAAMQVMPGGDDGLSDPGLGCDSRVVFRELGWKREKTEGVEKVKGGGREEARRRSRSRQPNLASSNCTNRGGQKVVSVGRANTQAFNQSIHCQAGRQAGRPPARQVIHAPPPVQSNPSAPLSYFTSSASLPGAL
jgi:hypothetical protein